MKKNLFFAALAITALVSCSESDYLGDEKQAPVSNDVGAISFGTGFKAVTRAVEGKAAADSLNYNFVVEGIKTVTANNATTKPEVFDNYNVNWTENTADKTLSNTANWEYVGQPILTGNTEVTEQSIKYWDFAASQYDFWAYSLGKGTATVSTLAHDATLGTSAYTIEGTKDDLAKVYISDLVTAYNPNRTVSTLTEQQKDSTSSSEMGNEVNLTFRSFVCKVRVGLYETIPGYSVKEVKFYPASSATDAEKTASATLFANSEVLPSFPASGNSTFTVYFPHIGKGYIGNSDYNKAHVTFDASGEKATKVEFGELSYGAKHKNEITSGNIWLGINTLEPTWATEAGVTPGKYSIVMPNEDGTVLTLKVDYTLESTDGTGEPITVHGATAIVPSQYTQWKSNYAYTYLFKISDNTNGLTNVLNTDKIGLYPITLDAIVVDTQENTQETITTVATPSITTYSTTSNVTVNNEYVAADSIYVTATEDGTLINMTDKATLYLVKKLKNDNSGDYVAYAATEAEVLDALTTYTSFDDQTGIYVGRDSIKLTPVNCGTEFLSQTEIPLADGNKITGLTAGQVAKINEGLLSAGNYYAFVYQKAAGDTPTAKYQAVTVPANGAVTGLFTTNDGSDAPATVNSESSQTVYAKYLTVDNAIYGIKVIKMTDASNP